MASFARGIHGTEIPHRTACAKVVAHPVEKPEIEGRTQRRVGMDRLPNHFQGRSELQVPPSSAPAVSQPEGPFVDPEFTERFAAGSHAALQSSGARKRQLGRQNPGSQRLQDGCVLVPDVLKPAAVRHPPGDRLRH